MGMVPGVDAMPMPKQDGSASTSNLIGVSLVCLVHHETDPPCGAEALARRMGALVSRLPRSALIDAEGLRHRWAISRLGRFYKGIVCPGLEPGLADELRRISGLPLLDARTLARPEEDSQ